MSFGVQSAGLFGASSQTNGTSTTSLRPLANLNLTEAQRTQIRDIFKTAKSSGLSKTQMQDQINAVLTPDQLATLQNNTAAASTTSDGTQNAQGASAPQGGNLFTNPNGPFANLNLTSDQQTQIAQIFSDAKSQGLTFDQINTKINAILTTSQQTTFASDLKNLPTPLGASGSSDASTASADVSGQSQSGSGDSTASTAGLTASDIQKQIAAAAALILKQAQFDLGISTS
jgi:Spy/CpxP family protein refolding chaperone